MLLQLGHLTLQAHHYTLPPLKDALWESLGQVLQDPRMMAQELEELLIWQGYIMLKIIFRSFYFYIPKHSKLYFLRIPQTDRMTAVLLLELSSVVELCVRLLCEAFGAQSEQLLQAVDQPLILLLQLHTALQLLTAGANTTQSTVQITLHIDGTGNFKI